MLGILHAFIMVKTSWNSSNRQYIYDTFKQQ